MKKLSLLMFVMVLTATKAFADYGWYNGSMAIGGVTTNVTAWSTDGDNPTDLGIVRDMTITSIAFNIWSDANDRGGANIYFRIWDGGASQVGSDQDLWLGSATRIAGNHDFAISWTGTKDLANAVGLTLENGKTYYIDMWAKTYGDSGDEWYSGGGANFHAKVTIFNSYTRPVTSGNFGTICLPFDATISGATAYKIVNTIGSGNSMTGLNLEPVDGLEAGKAYIFQATSSELTATCTGTYADATDANGMLGNLSSTAITLDGSTTCYVVQDNVVKKVVTGGTGVKVGQYKAYITLTGIQSTPARGANFIAFDNDETTGIDNIQAENGQNAVYNLQGQRVMNAQKGVFIVNGKKMLIK